MSAPRWSGVEELRAEQEAVARATPAPWSPPAAPSAGGPGLVAAGCFVAFRQGEQGPGRAGDRAWVGVAVWSEATRTCASATAVPGRAEAAYAPGLLALREAPMMLAALAPALDRIQGDAVLLVDGTGRDHPRRAGIALHLGHLLGVPSVGITHRPLAADRPLPALDRRGDSQALRLDGDAVAAWVCTADGARPVVAHAAWRTDVTTAVELALRTSTGARTPEPLRLARQVARNARAGTRSHRYDA